MTLLHPRTLVRGTGAGFAAFLVGYFVTWIIAGTRASGIVVGGFFGGAVPDWRALLWVFFDSHFVGTRTPQVVGPDGELLARPYLVDTVGTLGLEFLYLVPVVLTVAAGALAAFGVAPTPREGFRAGLTVAVGYLLAVLVGLFVASSGGVGPSPLRALVVAGVVYPLAFGALGGYLAGRFGTRRLDAGGEVAIR